jgi:CRISPR-associated protein Cas6
VILDLLFPALGESLPTDHAYPLYAALSRAVPAVHDPAAGVRFAPINGDRGPPGRIVLSPRSRLRLRLPSDRIPDLLPLAGRLLDVAGHRVRLGVPQVLPLVPAATLSARTVVVKNQTEPAGFLAAVRGKLDALGVGGEVSLPVRSKPGRETEACRRVVRVGGKRVIGFAVLVGGLTAAESVRLQESVVGGRGRLGCGFFLPVREGT